LILIIRITALLAALVLGGCQYVAVQSGQLSTAVNAFSKDSKALPVSLWSAQFGGYSASVQPVTVDNQTVFVNSADVISFDGWSITKVSGLKIFTPAWEIQDSGNQRSFLVKGRVVAMHQCEAWLKTSSEEVVRFEQHCIGRQAYTNTILVDNLGQITDIEQVVDSSLMVLRLRLNN